MSRNRTKAARRRHKAFLRCVNVRTADEAIAALRYVGRVLCRQFSAEEAQGLASGYSLARDGAALRCALTEEQLVGDLRYYSDRWNVMRYARVRESVRLTLAPPCP